VRHVRRASLLVLAAVALSSCRRPAPPLNLLIVTVDTTRGDRFGCYGYKTAHTPNFDALAAGGIQFDQAITAAPITLPSHSSIMTGTYPVFHGVHDNDGFVLDDKVTTLAEILKAKGFSTGAFIGSYPLSAQFHVNQGFDTYDDDFKADWTLEEARARTALAFGFLERKSDQVNAVTTRWLDKHASERFFLWVHYFDPHQPYDPPSPYDSQFATSPYDGEVAFMDENFGKLLATLKDKGVLDRTIVLVVGDHGESLEQHGEVTHASFLYDPTVHVPLLLSVPGQKPVRIPNQVRTIDIMPTLLELLGQPPAQDVQGKSLVPLIQDPARPWDEEALIETHFCQLQYGWAPLRALRTARYKLIEAPRLELYDLVADPGETKNLAITEPALASSMRERLARLASRMRGPDPTRSTGGHLSADTQEKLKALGYVGGGNNAARGVDFPDPEALAKLTNPMERTLGLMFANVAQEQLRQRNLPTCVTAARNGVEYDPTNFRLRITLAQCQAMMGLYAPALEETLRAGALRPDDPEAYALEGRIHVLKKQFPEAIKNLEKATALAPQFAESQRVLAATYAMAGRDEDAIRVFEVALHLDERSWAAHEDLAGAYARVDRNEEARQHYQRALELNPYSAQLLFEVGRFYASLGDHVFAREMLEAALQIAPNNPSVNVVLGELELGEPALAAKGREHLEHALKTAAPGSPAAKHARALLDGATAPKP
jgi:arylsulfatase A-like enzyme/tetratricopeptide (TPR) repeat protein